MACDIATLAAAGTDATQSGGLDKISTQAVKVYLLALILKALGGEDHTDVCAYAKSLVGYDGLPEYKLNAAYLVALGQLAQEYGVTAPSAADFKAVSACAHCCDVTPISMRTAETLLLCQISENLQ